MVGFKSGATTKPPKRVTFSSASGSVKEQRPSTQGKNKSRSAEGSADCIQSASSHDSTLSNAGRSKRARPHSKTTVVGASLKTRLHCNHLIPKCKCSSMSNRKKTHKTKHMVQTSGIQRRVLSSSRALPRGEINGRKSYQSTDGSVSICDATWRPDLNSTKDRSENNNENHDHKYRNGDERAFKKELRFEDQVTEHNERHNTNQTTNSGKDIDTNKSQKPDDIQPSSSIHIPSTHYRDSNRKTKERSGDYCRLCEAYDKGYFSRFNRTKEKDQRHNNHSETNNSRFCPEHDDLSSLNELCFLCHRYRNHKCIYDDSYCKICKTHLSCLQEDMTESEDSLDQQDLSSGRVAGGENTHTPLTKIPYEPRTKFVKNLKEKLETTYMTDESKKTSAETRVATEVYKDSDRQHGIQTQTIHHGKKCLHRYQQNDRLFLEPTITNRKGQSVCGECGASQPSNPHREPYLYHITLGGLKKNTDKRHGTASFNQFPSRGKENNRVCNMKSKKVSSDKSKFLYAKLNDSIDSVLGRKDIHSTFSRPTAPLNYHVPSYSKRHPSRSMALMDHII